MITGTKNGCRSLIFLLFSLADMTVIYFVDGIADLWNRSLPILQANPFQSFPRLLRLSVWDLLAHDDNLPPGSRHINSKRKIPRMKEKKKSRQSTMKISIPSGQAILL